MDSVTVILIAASEALIAISVGISLGLDRLHRGACNSVRTRMLSNRAYAIAYPRREVRRDRRPHQFPHNRTCLNPVDGGDVRVIERATRAKSPQTREAAGPRPAAGTKHARFRLRGARYANGLMTLCLVVKLNLIER
jgi:hypothetical protein